MSLAENAPSVIYNRKHRAPPQAVTQALIDATGYAVRQMQDNADPGPADFRLLLQTIQARWPDLDPDDRAFAAGYASGVVETQGRLLSRVPPMNEVRGQ